MIVMLSIVGFILLIWVVDVLYFSQDDSSASESKDRKKALN
ncbi:MULTISPECIES: hypothetical protein [Campylobacter]|nr:MULTISPECIES: hypothetical protein [Campylobacter]EJP75586.1 hypothetical protein HMPREF1139_0361 [Campylobacter sp. FOBRC14]MDU6826385.1 hypothetical protein [Campylobacter sp.]